MEQEVKEHEKPKYTCTDCGKPCNRQYDYGLCYECAAKEFGE